MSEAEIDLGQDIGGIERGKSSDIIPKGEYLVEVTGCRIQEKEGKRSIVAELTVKADTEGGKFVDSQFAEFLSLADGALWKVAAMLDAVYGQTFKGKTFPVKDVLGKRIAVHTFVDTYQGKDTTKVNKWKGASKFSGNTAVAGSGSGGTDSKEDVKV